MCIFCIRPSLQCGVQWGAGCPGQAWIHSTLLGGGQPQVKRTVHCTPRYSVGSSVDTFFTPWRGATPGKAYCTLYPQVQRRVKHGYILHFVEGGNPRYSVLYIVPPGTV